MKRKGKKQPIGKKGNLFWDEGADQRLRKPTQELGFKTFGVPPEYKNNKITDTTVLSEIMKGNMPVVTDDATQYTQTNQESKATGFIQHVGVSPENFKDYVLKWQEFLKQHRSTTLAGYHWKIPYKGKITQAPMKGK